MSSQELEYIRSVEIRAPRSRGLAAAAPPRFTSGQQAVVVGSQLCEFSPAIEPDTRAALSNCLLLAQLAADKAAGSPPADIRTWHEEYVSALRKTGWQVMDGDFQEQAVSTDGVVVHKEILPVITAFLGPAASAASIVVQMLSSLSAMQQNTPWITLFQDESQTLNGAKFQVSLVEQDDHQTVSVNLLSVGIEASQRITQVLFFKASRQTTLLRKASDQLSMLPGTLDIVSAAVAARVKEHLAENVMNIEI